MKTRGIGGLRTAALCAICSGLAGLSAMAQDEDYPPLRRGMWEVSRTLQSPDKPDQAKKLTFKKCADPVEEMKKQHAALKKLGCILLPPRQNGDTYSFKWQCDNDAVRGAGQTIVTVDGDSQYTAKTHSDGALPGTSGRTMEELSARRLGDCTG
jgi:Protein of unknown function (DUF3617)